MNYKGLYPSVGLYLGIDSRFAGGKGFVCFFGGEALSGSDRFDDRCAGIGFHNDMDCRSVDFCADCLFVDKSDEGHFAELVEPLAGKRVGSA